MNEDKTIMAEFGKHSLELDAAAEVARLVDVVQTNVSQKMRRGGAVVGISGGIDSAVVLALSARAFGPERVLGVLLPERESSPESATLALKLAERFGVATVTEDITGALEGIGCYWRRDEAMARVIPEYRPGWPAQIGLPGDLLSQGTLNFFHLTVTSPDGHEFRKRLPPKEFSQIVAASNFKQRTRMMTLYYHADALNYAVIGTANKNEHDLGFFVKYGDGGADIQLIAHLFKTQVYQLARYLDVPAEIQARTPTTDTYPGAGSQEEFFYRIPFAVLDAIWLGHERGLSKEQIAVALDLAPEQVERVVKDIVSKQRATAYLRLAPVVLDNPTV
jgi:NAD+ synthase